MKIQFEFEATPNNLTALRAFVDALGIATPEAPTSTAIAAEPLKPNSRKKADTIAATPVVEAAPEPQTEKPVEVAAEAAPQGNGFTLESVRALTREASGNVSKDIIVGLLKELGADSVSNLKPELYAQYVNSLKELV